MTKGGDMNTLVWFVLAFTWNLILLKAAAQKKRLAVAISLVIVCVHYWVYLTYGANW